MWVLPLIVFSSYSKQALSELFSVEPGENTIYN